MTKTVIPGYNGFAEWVPEPIHATSKTQYGAAMVGFPDDNAKTPVWDGTDFEIDGEDYTSPTGGKWIGAVSNFKINDSVVPSTIKYLKGYQETQRSASSLHSKAIEEITVEIETALQPRYFTTTTPNDTPRPLIHPDGAFGLFIYCIGDGVEDKDRYTPAVPAKNLNAVGQVVAPGYKVFCLGDNLGSVGFAAGIENSSAVINTGTEELPVWTTYTGLTNFMTFWGCKCQEATLSIAEDENVKLSSTWGCGGVVGPSYLDLISDCTYGTDYKPVYAAPADNKHVPQPDPLLDPIAYESVKDFKFRSKAPCDSAWSDWASFDPTRSIEISVSNDLKLIKDIGAPDHLKSTRIVGAVIMNREVTVTLEIDYNSFGLFEKVREFNEFQLVFDIWYDSCSTYHKAARFFITGVKFTEMPLELNPEDIIGDSITSLAVSGFSMEELNYASPAALPTT